MKRPVSAPWHIPDWAWALRAWHKVGRKHGDPRPKVAPLKVPRWYWLWFKWRNWADKNPLSPDAHPKPPVPPKPTVDPALQKARDLLHFCRLFDGRYVYGGGHGGSLHNLSVHQGLDCSSSVSLALFDQGLYKGTVAMVSTGFEFYGNPGRGKYVTIHANWEHVWIEFTLPEGWFRFDTSPHGSGPYGPRVRTGRRPDYNFVKRHPVGM